MSISKGRYDFAIDTIRNLEAKVERLQAIEKKYDELLGCVLFKHKNQTRHDTAKKYIVAMCEISDARNWKTTTRISGTPNESKDDE